LSPADDDAVTAHVEACARCQALLEQLIEDSSGARRAATNSPAQPSGPPPLPREADVATEGALRRLKGRPPSPSQVVRPESGTAEKPGDPGASLAAAVAPALPQVPGYEVLEEVGRGAMGVIYRARHLGLNRVVAIKMLQAVAQSNRTALARLRAEAEAVA